MLRCSARRAPISWVLDHHPFTAMAAVLDTRFDMQPFDAALGAAITGLDLSVPLSREDFALIHRAHLDHHVLVFRGQHITPAQQVAFSRRFGPLQIHVLRQFQLPTQPEVLIISNIKENGHRSAWATPAISGIRTCRTRPCPAWARCCTRRSCRSMEATPCLPTSTWPGTSCPATCGAPSKDAAPNTVTWPSRPNCKSAVRGAPT